MVDGERDLEAKSDQYLETNIFSLSITSRFLKIFKQCLFSQRR